MDELKLRELLEAVARGTASVEEAGALISRGGAPGHRAGGAVTADAGYIDLGHAKLDTDRRRRRGIAEAIFCQGKTREQVLEIAIRLDAAGQTVVCTRVAAETAEFVRAVRADFEYDPVARILWKKNESGDPGDGLIAVVTAGTTDIPVAQEAALCLELWGNKVDRIFDVGVAGVHRLFAARERLDAARVIIVAAGMEGALPSVVGGLVAVPVIAVPTSVGYGANFGGLAALLGMLNSCSGGISVVNIDNGFGAALVAHLINRGGNSRGQQGVPASDVSARASTE